MAIIKTNRMSLEEIKRMLEAGFSLRVVSSESGYPKSVLSNFCRAWGIVRKRGPKPGHGGRPKKAE
jgi:hypothetical protein